MLETPRIRLRSWREADREPFAAMNADPRVMQYFPKRLTPQESDSFVNRILEDAEKNNFMLWAVETLDENKFIGFTGLAVPNFEADFMPCVEIGWRLAFDVWGKGYATEGAGEVCRYAFEELDMEQLVSFTYVNNKRSWGVMERLGMTVAGYFDHPNLKETDPLRPHVLYTLSKEQWCDLSLS